MPLPKVSIPSYDLTLPSNNKKIKYRPFIVGEEKNLLLAMESEDINEIRNAVVSVLSNCVLTKGIDIEELPTFDIEYIFLNVRAKSIGESIDIIVTCGDDGETEVPLTIYIDEIKVKKVKGHTNQIKLSDDMTITMKYPSFDRFIIDNFDKNDQEDVLNLSLKIIASCIDIITQGDECWAASDYTESDLLEFLSGLTSPQHKQIDKFFSTMPKLMYETEVVNPNTEKKNKIVLEGLSDFFA